MCSTLIILFGQTVSALEQFAHDLEHTLNLISAKSEKKKHAHLRSFLSFLFVPSLLSLFFFFSGNSVRSVALKSIHPCFSANLPK